MTAPWLRRLLTPSAVLSIPPLAGIVILGLYVAIEAIAPGAMTAPRPANIPEAIVAGNGPRALEMLAEGDDVNASASVRPALIDQLQPGLSAQAPFDVTPLEAALLAQRIEVVRLLVGNGAEIRRSPRAACLARERLPEAFSVLGLLPADPEIDGLRTCLRSSGT